jgi:hypothetical protein
MITLLDVCPSSNVSVSVLFPFRSSLKEKTYCKPCWYNKSWNISVVLIHTFLHVLMLKSLIFSYWLVGWFYSWSYGSWIYNYQCNLCPSPLILWVRIPLRTSCATLCYKVYQWLAAGRWFSPGTPVWSARKTDRHDIVKLINFIT